MNTDRKPAELRLVNGTDTITIRPRSAGGSDPILCKAWDLGAPDIRFTQVANPGADGVTYSQGFVGSRTVTFDLAILGGVDESTGITHDAYWYANKLTQMSHPKASPVLQISRDDELNSGATWQMELRGSPYALPYTSRSAALLEMQLTFTCPLGLIVGPLISYTTSASGGDGGHTDLDMPYTLPFTFGLSGATYPKLTMNVGGDSTVAPIVYISGPVKDPEVRMGDGDIFAFKGLTLTSGENVYIDMATGTVRLGDSTGADADDMAGYGAVDWTVSSYFEWQPGIHALSYRNTTGSVTVQYRERRLTI